MDFSIEELMARFKCPKGVSVAKIIATVKPAQKCKGLKGQAFYSCMSRIVEEALIKAGCKPIG